MLRLSCYPHPRDKGVAAKRISELNEKASAKNAKALNKIAVGAPIKIGARGSYIKKKTLTSKEARV
jgi:hypothetical protein